MHTLSSIFTCVYVLYTYIEVYLHAASCPCGNLAGLVSFLEKSQCTKSGAESVHEIHEQASGSPEGAVGSAGLGGWRG